jgi:hypothetical protein
MLLLASAPALSTIAIILAASGGLIGAIVALLKLKPDANQSAVLQAQGAMETMVELQEQLERALARANRRADHYEAAYTELRERHDRTVEQWGPFPDIPPE